MSDDDMSYPMPTGKDKAISVGKIGAGAAGTAASIISGIPFLSLAATELFSRIVVPNLDKRRADWCNKLASRVKKLEDNNNAFEPQNLMENQLFITVLTHSLQIAIRNHQEEKHQALLNAVINSAKPLFPEDSLYLMFLTWIDEFTPWHIRILESLSAQQFTVTDGRIQMRMIPIVDKISAQFPRNEIDRTLIVQIFIDLANRGLITIAAETVIPKAVGIAWSTVLSPAFTRRVS